VPLFLDGIDESAVVGVITASAQKVQTHRIRKDVEGIVRW
jgi:hypothetical protein